ncbi:hypothetical protein ACJX0J_016244 [Zea mays]
MIAEVTVVILFSIAIWHKKTRSLKGDVLLNIETSSLDSAAVFLRLFKIGHVPEKTPHLGHSVKSKAIYILLIEKLNFIFLTLTKETHLLFTYTSRFKLLIYMLECPQGIPWLCIVCFWSTLFS